MFRGCWIIELAGWGVWKYIIVLVGLDEYCDVIDGVPSSAQKICVW